MSPSTPVKYMLSLTLKHHFLRSVSQDNRSKSKNEQLVPNRTYKLLHSKEYHEENKKIAYRLEKIFATRDLGFISKIVYKQLIQLNKKKPKQLNLKMDRRPK